MPIRVCRGGALDTYASRRRMPFAALTLFSAGAALLAVPSSAFAAAAPPPAAGAPIGQVIGATVAGLVLAIGLIVLGHGHRTGRIRILDQIGEPIGQIVRIPSWAALPVALATGSLLVAGLGFYWDVSVHIDRGRDPGPFGTPAHYPILLGLFGIFAAGWLAMAMPRGRAAARTGIRLGRNWWAPTSGVVMAACGSFALLGFPTDDVWHTIFGQDVTLWGPTHLMLLTGGQLVIVTILALITEGRAALEQGEEAAPGAGGRPRGRIARIADRTSRFASETLSMTQDLVPDDAVRRSVGAIGAGGVLTGLSVYLAEFDFGVPQYRLLFQPVLIAFTAALGLTMGRAIVGRGGALIAMGVYVALSLGFALVVSGRDMPHFALYAAEAVLVEIAGLMYSPSRRPIPFAVLAGVLIGTVGIAAEALWTHVWMPIPWPAHFVPTAIAHALPAAVCGGLIGVFVAGCLAPRRIARPGMRPWLPAAGALAVFAVLLGTLVPTTVPAGATATVTLTNVHGGSARTADATVVVHPASAVANADSFQQLSWQGHAHAVYGQLRQIGPGVYVTVKPIPVYGSWKSLLRLQKGNIKADVPVYLPADSAIPVPGLAAPAKFTRSFYSDTALMQRERKHGIPSWVWSTATLTVLAIILVLLVIIGWGLNRVATIIENDGQALEGRRARAPRGSARRGSSGFPTPAGAA